MNADLPAPSKGKSGDPLKISGDSRNNSEILFFFRSNPFSIKETRKPTSFQGSTPHSKWRTDAEKNDKLLNTGKDHRSVQKSSKVQYFSGRIQNMDRGPWTTPWTTPNFQPEIGPV